MTRLTYNSKDRNKSTAKQVSPFTKPETESPVETVRNAWQASLAAGASAQSGDSGPSPHQAIKLGIDVHLDRYVVLGVTNYVVRPRDWDGYGKKVKTDKRDAKAMVLSLDRYVSGNTEAFCVVRVPTEAQEQAWSRCAGSSRRWSRNSRP